MDIPDEVIQQAKEKLAVKHGWPTKLTPEQRNEVFREFATAEPPITFRALSKRWGITPQSVASIVKRRVARGR